MSSSPRRHASVLPRVLLALAALGPSVAAADLIFSQSADNGAIVASRKFDTPFVADTEAADDIDIVGGSVERMIVGGYNLFGCSDSVQGVYVRFYDWVGAEPGALQYEVFVPAGPDLVFTSGCPTSLDITLPTPFATSGKHFVSAQLVTNGWTGWNWWSSNTNNPEGAALRVRDNVAGGGWLPQMSGANPVEADLAFQLWGQGPPPVPPTVMLWATTGSFAETVPSVTWPNPPKDVEAADDFDLIAQIERLVLSTSVCYQCAYPQTNGAWIRFYDWVAGEPGALQYEQFVPLTPPISSLSLTLFLPVPFQATGKHFVSVQLDSTNENGWAWRATNDGQPTLSRLKVRDNLSGGGWTDYLSGGSPVDGDLYVQIWGKNMAPPIQPGTDPCGDWEVLQTPIPAPETFQQSIVRDLAVGSANDVWAVGDVLVTWPQVVVSNRNATWHWDGTSWTDVPVPTPEPYSGAGVFGLRAVEYVAADDVWAAGGHDLQDTGGFVGTQPLVLNWDGSSWNEVPAPTTATGTNGAHVHDIEAIASDEIWFVGEWLVPFGCDMALAMRWDGSDFTVYPTPCSGLPGFNGGKELEAVSAVSSNDVWAVGGSGDDDMGINHYIIHWDGSTWSHVDAPLPGVTQRLYDVEAIATDDVWAVGAYFDLVGYKPYALHWDGTSWTLHTGEIGSSGLHAFGPNDVYSVGGGVYHWNGSSWRWVEDFGQTQGEHGGVSLTAVDAVQSCSLWTGGREVVAGSIVPFTARHGGVPSTWTDLGGGTLGIAGPPTLAGSGDLNGGSSVAVSLANAPPDGLMLAWLSFASVPLDVFGGTIHATPAATQFFVSADAAGQFSISATWPMGVPSGTDLWFQFLLDDPSSIWGITLSNALRLTTP